ncbi:hypothetical protein K435DRAFT_862759 [Dendrothele bispora CBS 962.96]|uniref:Uncharacterized protein n=1 Tax=Dendrothele bispora (strain CBS 962.96) TaxID=1314807 RepID=A0A4S8LRJ6_DENBC|nr:hypothetical protein K435DRAFT_862759 [Dendrothele bispora CBS 962.96]
MAVLAPFSKPLEDPQDVRPDKYIVTSEMDATLTLYDMFTRIWTTEDSLKYLDTLAVQFLDKPMECVNFLCLITDWWCGTVPSTEMVIQASTFLRHHPRLLRELNCILKRPKGEVRIVCPVDSQEVECVVALYVRRTRPPIAKIHLIPRSLDSSRPELLSHTTPPLWSTEELHIDFLSRIHLVDPLWAPFVMELLQVVWFFNSPLSFFRKKLIRSMQLLSNIKGALFPSIFVHDVSREGSHVVTGGGFADIWKGRRNGQLVCLKVLRFFTSSPEDRAKLFKVYKFIGCFAFHLS